VDARGRGGRWDEGRNERRFGAVFRMFDGDALGEVMCGAGGERRDPADYGTRASARVERPGRLADGGSRTRKPLAGECLSGRCSRARALLSLTLAIALLLGNRRLRHRK